MSVVTLLILGTVFVLVMIGVMVYALRAEAKQKKRIMMAVKGEIQIDGDSTVKDATDDPNKRREGLARKLKENQDAEKQKSKKKIPTNMLLQQAGLDMSVRQFWIYSFISMAGFVGLSYLFGYSLFVISMFGIIGLFGVPRMVLKFLIGRRQKNFLTEFPDALEATVRLLKAGMPVSEAVYMISREYEGPVGEEMARMYDQQKIGLPLHEAALEATHRMPLPEMQMFATGLAIQAQTGSSLSEVLTNMANVIRARFRLKRKVKALSSEAIASASIIGALPIMVAGGMYFVNTEYIMILFTTVTGKALLIGAVIWMAFGIMAMKVMINFKI